jgi:peptide subunit release factor RF-3
MVPAAAMGTEEQAAQALRGLPASDVPIITFVNNLDREDGGLIAILTTLKSPYSHATFRAMVVLNRRGVNRSGPC